MKKIITAFLILTAFNSHAQLVPNGGAVRYYNATSSQYVQAYNNANTFRWKNSNYSSREIAWDFSSLSAALRTYKLPDGDGTLVLDTRTLTINGTTYDLSANRSWTVSGGSGPSSEITLTDGATITWAAGSGPNATVTLGGTGRTLTITSPTAGETYVLRVKQDGTGNRTITTWPTGSLFPGGILPSLTGAANSTDIVSLYYNGTNFFVNYNYNFK